MPDPITRDFNDGGHPSRFASWRCDDCGHTVDTPQHELGCPADRPLDLDDPNDRVVRKFETGATRDTDRGKLDYEGFLSPAVLEAFARYMNRNRVQPDGAMRDSDNWQKGIPQNAYMKSLWRHFMDAWQLHRGLVPQSGVDMEEALCAVMFNTMGYLYEVLKADGRTP